MNLNNVVIIADTITFNCPNVNANYSSSAAEFVGTVSELLDIPDDEWQYMKDENENDFPDFFEDFDNWSKLKDTDGDKLPDCVEQYIGSDSALVDTDGDALDDFYELFVTYTEPAKDDTDDNGILDCDEDFDKDDLSNLEEYLASTSPWDDDTDSDTLKDGEEIDTYGTDPLKPDTDDDGLEDSDEIYLGTDPADPDTDSDGILDGDEKFYQTYTHIVENEDCVVSEVIVSLEGTGNLQKNTTVKSVMNKDVLCTNVAGLVGEPFNIETSSQFDTATITFKIDQSKLGDTEFDNLMFLWYDEENNEFVELETVLDEPNSTVSVVTTHFSKYMIVDRQAWYDAWALEFNYGRQFDNSGAPLRIYNTVLAIDCSGSMTSYDSDGEIRTNAALGLIGVMNPNDRIAVVLFDSYVNRFMALTNDQAALTNMLNRIYSSGGTDFDAALQSSIALLQDEIGMTNVINRIIFMTDGQDSISTNVLDVAKDNNIKVYTIGFSTNTSDSNLQYYADYTGGEFYKAYNAEELIGIYENLGSDSDFDTTDTDGDGLFDVVEIAGMRMQNGYVGGENGAPLTTDPTNPDTDGDGLLDGEEIDQTISWKRVINDTGDGSRGAYCIYFNMLSDPTKVDTDGDGVGDGNDAQPLSKFDQRFMLVDSLDYVPKNDFVETHYEYGQECFASIDISSAEYDYLYAKYALYALVGLTPFLNYYVGDLLAEKTENSTTKFSEFLTHYINYVYDTNRLENDNIIYLNDSDMNTIINTQTSNMEHFSYNVNQMCRTVESLLKSGSSDSICLSTTSKNHFKATCYSGNYCNAHTGSYDNTSALDWGYAIGESMCEMVAEAGYDDGQYVMKLRYYLLDVYEFPVHWNEFDADDDLTLEAHYLHETGVAREYKISGVIEFDFSWKYGDILYPDYYISNIVVDNYGYDLPPIS